MVELGNLVASVNSGSEIKLLILLVNIVLLQELGALDLVRLQQLQISLSKVAAVLQVVDTLSNVALVELLSNKTGHHSSNPLLSDEGILGSLEGFSIIVIDAIEGRRNGGLLSLKLLGLGSRHGESECAFLAFE